MRHSLCLTAFLLVSMVSASSVRADGWYMAVGAGGNQVEDQLGQYADGGASARIALGRRVGPWAIEAFLGNDSLSSRDQAGQVSFYSLDGYGLSARYIVPVTSRLEIYVRGGLHKMSTTAWEGFRLEELEGRALHYGLGAQLKGEIPALGLLFYPLLFTDIGPKITAALWIESVEQVTRLHHRSGFSVDADVATWMIGVGIGRDF